VLAELCLGHVRLPTRSDIVHERLCRH
jgi:hypothetical protein